MITRSEFLAELGGQPQLVDEARGQSYINALMAEHRMSGDRMAEVATSGEDRSRSYQVIDGIAIIPIVGFLWSRAVTTWWGESLASYPAICDMVADAVNDANIRAVILDIASPGGLASGCLDAAEKLASLRGTKPIYAVVPGCAASAAYALACAADRIVISQDADVGSIGVCAMHVDMSAALEQWGVKVTFLYKGKHKVDGARELPLSDQARNATLHKMEIRYIRFCAVVAANRGMSVDAVRATEAAVYCGDDAVKVGLADEIATMEEVIMTLKSKTAEPGASLATPSADPATAVPGGETAAAPAAATPATETTLNPPTLPAGEQAADPGALAQECATAGLPELTAGLISARATMTQVKARIAEGKEIKATAAKLGLPSMAATLIASGVSLDAARNLLNEAKVAGEAKTPTDSTAPAAQPGQTAQAGAIDVASVYAKHNRAKER